ncbi:adenosine deaminase family protein [Roseomonas sp. USHLN139]|uniref:adenosine deaminase family protein n=1 Tax=Roseomonas sp. USHLN139 TaxID=3081298 RepID=UPI003B01CB03
MAVADATGPESLASPGASSRAELHLHLEGAIGRATLNRLGARHGLPPLAEADLHIACWADSQRAFEHVLARLRGPQDWFDATLALFDRLVAEDIAYAEASIMPVVHAELGLPFAALWPALRDALEAGEAATGRQLRLLFAIPRNAGAAAGYATLDCLQAAAHPAVVGIDLAGEERADTILPFAPVFAEARRLGLRTAAHAGEFGGPERVAQTLEALAPDRLHHGIAAAADPALLRQIAASGIGVDVAPRSNLAFGAVRSLAAVPVAALVAAGIRVSLSTDDPALVGNTLPGELGLLRDTYRLDEATARGVEANAFRSAFGWQGATP